MWRRTVIVRPEWCRLADNVNGVLRCLKRAQGYVPGWGEEDVDEASGGGIYATYMVPMFQSPWRAAKLILVWLSIAVVATAFLVAVMWTCSLYFLGAKGGKGDD